MAHPTLTALAALTTRTDSSGFAVAALSIELTALDAPLRVIPAGQFRAKDGRPFDAPYWHLDEALAAQVIKRAQAHQDDLVVDYEHQTLSGSKAPAAGWFKQLAWRDDGLYITDFRPTDTARAEILSHEYRYLSPVLRYDTRTGDVLELMMVALTNFPGLDGLTDLSKLAALRFTPPTQQEHTVDQKELIKLLGLPDDATLEAILAAIQALQAQSNKAEALATQVTGLTATLANHQNGKPDPTQWAPVAAVTALQAQVTALSARQTESEVDTLIQAAQADGRLLPPLRDWAYALGNKDVAALRSFLDKVQPIAALTSTQTHGLPPAPAGSMLSAEESAVAALMGQTEADYLKAKG